MILLPKRKQKRYISKRSQNGAPTKTEPKRRQNDTLTKTEAKQGYHQNGGKIEYSKTELKQIGAKTVPKRSLPNRSQIGAKSELAKSEPNRSQVGAKTKHIKTGPT